MWKRYLSVLLLYKEGSVCLHRYLTSQRIVTRGLYQSERFAHTIPVADLRTPGVDLHVQVPHVKIHRTYSEGTQSRCSRDQVVERTILS